jgi:hypothetical protein
MAIYLFVAIACFTLGIKFGIRCTALCMFYIDAIAHGQEVNAPNLIDKIIAIAAQRILQQEKEKLFANSKKSEGIPLLEALESEQFRQILMQYPYLKNLLVFGILRGVSEDRGCLRIMVEQKHLTHELVMQALYQGAIIETV